MKTTVELIAARQAIEADPKNLMPKGSFYRFTPAARRRLNQIDWEITENMRRARAEAGNPVACDGYSGRQTNRR